MNLRTEVGTRVDFDDQQANNGKHNQFTDLLASVGMTLPSAQSRWPRLSVSAALQQTCADMDDDGDGANNCNDKCPNSQAGQTIYPDGCPVPVSIDLEGRELRLRQGDFASGRRGDPERSHRNPEALPGAELVEVAGHTDQCGKEGYNQKLSERRAKTVYDFLTSNGVDALRLAGPNGYGFSRPLEDKVPNKLPQCKSEINRRTELNSK